VTNVSFDLTGRVAVVTGGGGMLGLQHASVLAELGAVPVLLDVSADAMTRNARSLTDEFGAQAECHVCDITNVDEVRKILDAVVSRFDRLDILINNAARNPKVETDEQAGFTRLEDFPWEEWQLDLDVGLGGAFNCARVFGAYMATQERGVIVNIASDLGVIAPDQRLYRVEGRSDDLQPVKPVTYSVVKHGLIGLTKYIATYWADRGVRCNTLSPGGIYAGQSDEFVRRLSDLVPLGRMANADEYRGAIAFLCSDASSYMNGANLIVDGGRSTW
jgi:NAD(P)-dependent dehydrogenase (short-subunit alcohol dehydrogenase family)